MLFYEISNPSSIDSAINEKGISSTTTTTTTTSPAFYYIVG